MLGSRSTPLSGAPHHPESVGSPDRSCAQKRLTTLPCFALAQPSFLPLQLCDLPLHLTLLVEAGKVLIC